MPSFSTADLPKPRSWDEFEDIVADMLKRQWRSPYVVRNGRSGQQQNGVDIYGQPAHLQNGFAGVQCKRVEALTIAQIQEEIAKAESFEPALTEYMLAVSLSRDVALQRDVRELSQQRQTEGKFPVHIFFWEDICLEISGHRDLMVKHFPQFVEPAMSVDKIREMILNSDWDDWEHNDEMGIFTYKNDVNLTIRRQPYEEGHDFDEDWLHRYPDPHGRTLHHHIYYGSSFIEQLWIVGVDGFRCLIPYPDRNHTLSKYSHKIGTILNHGSGDRLGGFDSYLERGGIRVEGRAAPPEARR